MIYLLLLAPFSVLAGNITVDITFEKRATYAAIVYLNDGGNQSNTPVDQKNKNFVSRAYVNSPNAPISFMNSDGIDHNIYANSPTHGVKFDIGLLEPSGKVDIATNQWPIDAIVRIGCKIHPKMKSYIANVATSNSEVITFKKGVKEYTTTLKDVIDSNAPVNLWLPKYDPIQIQLKPGEKQTLDLMRKGKKKGTVTFTYQS